MIRMNGHVWVFAAAILAAGPAAATTYILDFTERGGDALSDTFGDSAEADLSYRAIDATAYGDVGTTGAIGFWGPGYGDLTGAGWGLPNPSHGEIRIESVNPSETVRINGFSMGGWTNDELAEWRVYDLSWTLIESGSGVAPNISGHLTASLSAAVSTGGLIFQWGNDAWDVGIQDFSFSIGDANPVIRISQDGSSVLPPSPVNRVPLPAGAALGLTALGALGVSRRRR